MASIFTTLATALAPTIIEEVVKQVKKLEDGLNILGGDKVQKLVNSPVLDVVAGRYGKTGLLQGVRQGMGQIDNAKKFANAGAELGNIFQGVADKGVNKNTIERVSKLSQSLA